MKRSARISIIVFATAFLSLLILSSFASAILTDAQCGSDGGTCEVGVSCATGYKLNDCAEIPPRMQGESPIFRSCCRSSNVLPPSTTGTTDAAQAGQAVNAAGQQVGAFLNNAFAGLFTDSAWFTRALLGMLLFMIIYSLVGALTAGGGFITLIASLIITALSVMFLPNSFVGAIALQYGAMGAAILTIIPFVIMLIFTVRLKSILVGRILWVFYVVYYFALFMYRLGEIGFWTINSIPYWAAIIGGVIVFFFIIKIKEIIFKEKLKDIQLAGKEVAARRKALIGVEKESLEAFGKA